MSIELATVTAAEHKAAIRERIRNRIATPQDFIAYNVLRGKAARNGFQPQGAGKRPQNGQGAFNGFLRASQLFTFSSFGADRLHPELVACLSDAQQASVREERVKALSETFEQACAAGLPTEQLKGLLRWAMAATPQGRHSVLEHCELTHKFAVCLVNFRRHGSKVAVWRGQTCPTWLPDWFFESPHTTLAPAEFQLLFRYLAMHDCGKPFVYLRDETGRAHFPGHALRSAEIWRQAGGSEHEQYLMEHDMALHTLKADGLEEFSKGALAKVQLVAALASLWANIDDFGGAESVSFKAKLKHLDRRGRALCRIWADSTVALSS